MARGGAARSKERDTVEGKEGGEEWSGQSERLDGGRNREDGPRESSPLDGRRRWLGRVDPTVASAHIFIQSEPTREGTLSPSTGT